MLSLSQPCALLSILVSDVEHALHDHTYVSKLVTTDVAILKDLDQETTAVATSKGIFAFS